MDFKIFENKCNEKLVPPINDRINIINKANLLVHFRLEKTYRDIASKY